MFLCTRVSLLSCAHGSDAVRHVVIRRGRVVADGRCSRVAGPIAAAGGVVRGGGVVRRRRHIGRRKIDALRLARLPFGQRVVNVRELGVGWIHERVELGVRVAVARVQKVAHPDE